MATGPPPARTGRPRERPPFVWVVAALVAVAVILIVVRLPGAVGGRSGPSPAPYGGGAVRGPHVVAPPPCRTANLVAPFSGYSQWDRTLLDTTYGVLASYEPPGLVPISRAGFAGDLRVRSLVVPSLAALRMAAAAAGHPLAIEAAYRSHAQQVSLFHRRAGDLGRSEALSRTARPGHSEHQLGTTIDFKPFGAQDVTQDFGSTPTGRWLATTAWRFGFALSYPRARVAMTCYGYEPWHFRYFGKAVAARIHASGLTVRQYLWNEEHVGSP